MQFERLNGKDRYEQFDPPWEDEDDLVSVRRSVLKRERNVHLLLGSIFGVAFTVAVEFLFLWVKGVF